MSEFVSPTAGRLSELQFYGIQGMDCDLGSRRGKGDLLVGGGGCLGRSQTHRSPADSREAEARFFLAGTRCAFLPARPVCRS